MYKLNKRDFLTTSAACAAVSACATSGSSGAAWRAPVLSSNYFDETATRFPQFAVIPEFPKYGFNFEAWNKVSFALVMDFGRSDRISRSKPPGALGSRIPKGHQSPYRTEANRIPFSFFTDDEVSVVSQVRQILVDLGNTAPLSEFSWGDQLAFWFNLHNALMVEQLALNYPVKFPERLRIGPNREPLHTAKLVTINDTPLSLYDIRVEIVYRHWRHPGVIYGFFHGDVGGPSIRRGAYSGKGINRHLGRSAGEFVNALRGVREYSNYIGVSRLYDEARPLFPNWQDDMRRHLFAFADEEVDAILETGKPLQISQYDNRIADLIGGDTSAPSASRTPATGIAPSDIDEEVGTKTKFGSEQITVKGAAQMTNAERMPPHAMRTLRERIEKDRNLRRREGFRSRGTVTIEDLPDAPVQ